VWNADQLCLWEHIILIKKLIITNQRIIIIMFKGMYKGLKKVTIDPDKSHLTLKGTDFPLVILRPYDMVSLGALVGSGSEDILIWIGKTIGKNLSIALQSGKIKKREKLILLTLDMLSNLGFGKFSMKYAEGKSAKIHVQSPISNEIKDKKDAKVLCNLYNGLFIGIFSGTGVDVDGDEKECVLEGKRECVFEYEFEE
jgi:predicted hydrocarbon binding protein